MCSIVTANKSNAFQKAFCSLKTFFSKAGMKKGSRTRLLKIFRCFLYLVMHFMTCTF